MKTITWVLLLLTASNLDHILYLRDSTESKQGIKRKFKGPNIMRLLYGAPIY